MSGTVHKPVHRFVEICIDGSGDVAVWVGRAITDAADVFGGVLLPAGERVSHVRFQAVSSPMT